MAFRLTKSSREWLRYLFDSFELAFDAYYMGAVVGMLEGRKATVNASEAPELVDDFPELYRPCANVLIGMLMAAELRAAGSPLRDKKLVHRVVGELVDLRSHSRLSDLGVAALNEYAEGGLQLMRAWFEEPPRIKSVFLLRYVARVQALLPTPLPV